MASDPVVDYLARLERELAAVPADKRAEVIDEVRSHIAEARAELGDGEAAIRTVLDRVGEPAAIAAEARERFDIAPVRVTWIEVAALILLPIGAFIVPIVGWIVGVVFLWMSPVWTQKEKLLGTLVWPGGLAFPLFASAGGVLMMPILSATGADRVGGLGTVVLGVTFVLGLIAPVVVLAHLIWKMRARTARVA